MLEMDGYRLLFGSCTACFYDAYAFITANQINNVELETTGYPVLYSCQRFGLGG